MQKASVWRVVLLVTGVVVAVLMGACARTEEAIVQGNRVAESEAASQPPFKPVASVQQLMHDVVYPNADAVWESVGTIISYEGTEEIYPRNDEEWAAVQSSAVILTEAGNLLMIGSRAKDAEVWMERAQALVDAGAVALKAAETKDAAAIFASGEQIYNACQDCHMRYRYDDDPSIIRR